MTTYNLRCFLVSLAIGFSALLTAACSESSSANAGPIITVYKTSTCQCCGRWVQHLKDNGFVVKVQAVGDVAPVRRELGEPDGLATCHVASVDGYIVEGHVPAADIRRLLAERPAVKGIVTPGMPIGSPGMEQGDRKDPYEVLTFTASGETGVFAKH